MFTPCIELALLIMRSTAWEDLMSCFRDATETGDTGRMSVPTKSLYSTVNAGGEVFFNKNPVQGVFLPMVS
jgi:hypothetical protein